LENNLYRSTITLLTTRGSLYLDKLKKNLG
jgi:hypothetical protein